MKPHWDSLIKPLVDAACPRVVVEVGTGNGDTTRLLLSDPALADAVVHSIDPEPGPAAEELEERFGERLVLHRSRSLGALARIEGADLVLIDGDHNWYTVLHELKLIEKRARIEGRPVPPVLLHDVGWPYGRRDMYYDPESIPDSFRQPHRRAGIHPGDPGLAESGGLNPHLENAIDEHDLRNGVLTAVEDFAAESDRELELTTFAGFHGLAVLADRRYLEREPGFARALKALGKKRALRERLAELERARLSVEIERSRLKGELESTARRASELKERAAELGEQAALIPGLERDRERLKDDLAAAEEERNRLRADLSSIQQERDGLAEERGRLASRLEEAERVGAEAQEGLERAWSLRSEEMKAAAQERGRLESEVARLAGELESEVARLAGELDRIKQDVERAAGSRSWRYGHRLARLLRVLTFRRPVTEGALDRALGRIEAEQRRLGERAPVRAIEAPNADSGRKTDDPGAPPLLPAAGPAAPERDAADPDAGCREQFGRRYWRLLADAPGALRGRELAMPLPGPAPENLLPGHEAGEHGRAEGNGSGASPSVDVIVCVHDAFEDVSRCLWSLLAKTREPFHLILVDDGSSEPTAGLLADLAREHPEIELIRNDLPPHGYTVAANLGLRASRADYAVLLNSDTEVTPGWLQRIVDCGESDPAIGIVGPLSNAATHQSIPAKRDGEGWAVNELPGWLTPDGMGFLVEALSERERPRLPFINGFCFAIKRGARERVGAFDQELFAEGYCEENDFCMRAEQLGISMAVADDAYVQHAKSRSYGAEGRAQVARRHYAEFERKHGAEAVRASVERLEADDTLEPLREAVRDATRDIGALRRTFERLRPNPLSVGFVLPGIADGSSGGAHSVYQEAAGMRELGVDARVLLPASFADRAAAAYPDAELAFTLFDGQDELAERSADLAVIVATHFTSVPMVAALRDRREFLPAYYIQDYEPFIAEQGSRAAAEAAASYAALPDMVRLAKTHWLCNVVAAAHRVPVAKVPPGIDRSVFHPGERRPADGPVRIAAMVRPRTPRRQPRTTALALERLRRELGDAVEVTSFGCPTEAFERVTGGEASNVRHAGLLRRDEVADLLRRTDLFLDLSVYQAFGRTALEAMACGAAAVVPRLGGAAEFAVHGENALIADSADSDRVHREVAALVRDRPRLERMRSAAAQTAQGYSVTGAALSEYLLFEREHRMRFRAETQSAGAFAARARRPATGSPEE